jgi:hypothetical protein
LIGPNKDKINDNTSGEFIDPLLEFKPGLTPGRAVP